MGANEVLESAEPKRETEVFIARGSGGWGKGLYLRCTPQRYKVASLTGGGIHPVAKKIAALLNCPVVNAFEEKVELEEMVCVVLDCGGTARMGVYPMKNILTINVKPASPSGPLAKHITENVFVSGVTVNEVNMSNGSHDIDHEESEKKTTNLQAEKTFSSHSSVESGQKEKKLLKLLTFPAFLLSYGMGFLYQAGKEAVNSFLTHVLPLMLGVSVLIGSFSFFNLEKVLSNIVYYSMGNLPGLLIMAVLFSIPIFSNYLGAGATLGQVLIVLLGYEIAQGNIDFIWLFPALFATNVQVGCDFLPTALSMSNCEEKTVRAGLKAVAYSRLITSVVCVLIAYGGAKLAGF